MSRLGNDRGLGIVELMIWTAVAGTAALTIAHFGTLPQQIYQYLTASVNQQTSVKALDIVVSDLKEATAASFPFATMSPSSSDWFQTSVINAGQPYLYINYSYQPAAVGSATGSLVRCQNAAGPTPAGASCSTVLTPIQDPALGTPLFQQDSVLSNIIIVTVTYQPPWTTGFQNPALIKTVRRASIRS